MVKAVEELYGKLKHKGKCLESRHCDKHISNHRHVIQGCSFSTHLFNQHLEGVMLEVLEGEGKSSDEQS